MCVTKEREEAGVGSLEKMVVSCKGEHGFGERERGRGVADWAT